MTDPEPQSQDPDRAPSSVSTRQVRGPVTLKLQATAGKEGISGEARGKTPRLAGTRNETQLLHSAKDA